MIKGRWAARLAPVAALALLAACGGKGGDARTEASDAPAEAPSSPAATASVDCTGLPEFVKLYADATVSICTRGQTQPGRMSGTVIYATAASGPDVLAWYKTQAADAGMSDAVSSGTMYSARGTNDRTFMALVAPGQGGTRVTLNWGESED